MGDAIQVLGEECISKYVAAMNQGAAGTPDLQSMRKWMPNMNTPMHDKLHKNWRMAVLRIFGRTE